MPKSNSRLVLAQDLSRSTSSCTGVSGAKHGDWGDSEQTHLPCPKSVVDELEGKGETYALAWVEKDDVRSGQREKHHVSVAVVGAVWTSGRVNASWTRNKRITDAQQVGEY